MKIIELLNEENSMVVLTKMATTIDPSTSKLNGYTNNSCFGRVAHFLKTNHDPNWYILLFGFRQNGEVTHCCLYDDDGNRIVDTFDGEPVNRENGIVYLDKHGNEHELLASLTVAQFQQRFLKQ